MNRTLTHFFTRITCVMLFVGLSSTTHALTIVLNDVGTTPMTTEQFAAFREAADIWEATYSDPIVVNVNVAFNNLADGILGSTLTARTTHSYATVRNAMLADVGSSILINGQLERDAINALPTTSLPVTIFSGDRNDTSITMGTANAKALGLGTTLDTNYQSLPPGVDMRIQFNTDFEETFDYDQSDGIDAGLTDFVAVALHEIGHGLGFFSVTDVQDNNPTFTLRANTLDIWRFSESGGSHDLLTEPRFITAGDAEHWDSVLNNETMSHGVDDFDTLCNSSSNRCQASHWSDDLGHLMDPTLGRGILENIDSVDNHAIDFIGYNRPQWWVYCCIELIPLWDFWWFWPLDIPPVFDHPSFPEPELPQEIPEWANAGWVSIMDLGPLGLRSGIGFARYDEGGPIDTALIQPSENVEGEMNLNPPGEPKEFRYPTIYEMEFHSDQQAGVPFVMKGTCGELGCEFDPTIGDVGGYRISTFVDGLADGEGDVDAKITLILLADESGIPNPQEQNVFKLHPDSQESTLMINDFAAFELEEPSDEDQDGIIDVGDNCSTVPNQDQRDTNDDGFGNACDPDLNNDGIVNFIDVGLFAEHFNTANNGDPDFNGDGFVNFLDFAIFPNYFLQAPGPSGLN